MNIHIFHPKKSKLYDSQFIYGTVYHQPPLPKKKKKKNDVVWPGCWNKWALGGLVNASVNVTQLVGCLIGPPTIKCQKQQHAYLGAVNESWNRNPENVKSFFLFSQTEKQKQKKKKRKWVVRLPDDERPHVAHQLVSVIPALPPSNCYTHVGGKGRGQWWKNSVREEETNASFYYHGRRKKK